MRKALLREVHLPRRQSLVADRLPLGLGAGLGPVPDKVERHVQIVETHSEVEAVVRVGRDLERELLEVCKVGASEESAGTVRHRCGRGLTLGLQEASDPIPLVARDGGQDFVGGGHITAQNCRLIFDDSEGQGKAEDGHVFVRDVNPIVRGEVAEQVHVPEYSVIVRGLSHSAIAATHWSKWLMVCDWSPRR